MLAELFGPDGLIVIIAVVVVLLFGGSKLPKLARSLGGASREFKRGVAEGDPDAAIDTSKAIASLAKPCAAVPEKDGVHTL